MKYIYVNTAWNVKFFQKQMKKRHLQMPKLIFLGFAPYASCPLYTREYYFCIHDRSLIWVSIYDYAFACIAQASYSFNASYSKEMWLAKGRFDRLSQQTTAWRLIRAL